MSTNTQGKNKIERRIRSATDTDIILNTPLSSSIDVDNDVSSHKERLFKLFDLIEKEFDDLYAENTALRLRLNNVSGHEVDSSVLQTETIPPTQEGLKGSGRKAMQVGQRLRTALRGPPTRLVFKVGTDDSRFKLSRRIDAHKDGVWHVACDSTRGICGTASADQTSSIWSLENGKCLGTYVGHSGSVNCVAFSPNTDNSNNETTVVTASGDESAHIWKASLNHFNASSDDEGDERENDIDFDQKAEGSKIKTPLIRLTGHTGAVVGCEWLLGGNQVITASWDRFAHIYDVEKGEILNILSGHEQELTSCSSHHCQRLVATSSKDSTFRLWDFRESIQSVAVFQGHQDSVTSVAFSLGDRIVSASDDRTVKVWDLRNMRSSIATVRLPSPSNKISISQAHGLIAIPLDNRHVRIHDLSGNRVQRIPNRRCHNRLISSVAWIEDNPMHNLVTAGFDRTIAYWKVVVGKE
ncbi:unnamed protein product [Auanema sp. JU1783]|nr:unnamed protein product [Auanema sp. JU1783]